MGAENSAALFARLFEITARSATIYAHLDNTTTVGQTAQLPAAAAAVAEQNFGRVVRRHGRLAVFELDLGNRHKVITFVIWA